METNKTKRFFIMLKTGSLTFLVALLVVGICVLATQTTSPLATVASVSTTPKAHQKATTDISVALNAQPQQPAEKLPVPQSTMAASVAGSTQPQLTQCNEVARKQATYDRVSQLRQEAARHKHVVWRMQTTGLVTRFLNPNMYTYRQTKESTLHKSYITHITRNYQAALLRAHC